MSSLRIVRRGACVEDFTKIATHAMKVSPAKPIVELAKGVQRGRISPATVGRMGVALRTVGTVSSEKRLWDLFSTVLWYSQEPVHVPCPVDKLLLLVDSTWEASGLQDRSVFEDALWSPIYSARDPGRLPSKEEVLGFCPRKAHPMAGKKANVFLDQALIDLHDESPKYVGTLMRVCSVVRRCELFEDQLCNVLLYAWCARGLLGFERAVRIGLTAVLFPDLAKALSNVIKVTGNNMSQPGAVVCELNVLLGRGVGRVDFVKDATRRLAGNNNPAEVNCSKSELREAVRAIYNEELPTQVVLPSLDQHWDARYRWCVSGSHSKSANAHWFDADIVPSTVGPRLTRRMVSENVAANPLLTWDGRVGVSMSEKLECGKSRALYACDTLSYFAFSWLLKPVEDKWAGRKIILDPGGGGVTGMVARIRGLKQSSSHSCYTMLDYSDFNSQHSIASQKIVIEELLKHVGASESKLGKLLVASFDKMSLYYKGEYMGRAGSTLMSGHRGTSFINSVLNAAYVRIAVGRQQYREVQPLHVGDDVVMICEDENVGWSVIRALERMGCGLQRSKQSVGRLGFEFLRLAGDPERGCTGYLARVVASLVSGNWTSELAMDALPALHSLVHQARSLINRSGQADAYRVLLRSAAMMVGIARTVLAEFLSGQVAIAPGPCFRQDGRYTFRFVFDRGKQRISERWRRVLRSVPHRASEAYVARGRAPVEELGMRLAGLIPWEAMASASYGSMEPSPVGEQASRKPELVISGLGVRLKAGEKRLSEVTTSEAKHGRLVQYPILALLRNVLSESDVRHLLDACGFEGGSDNPMLDAWGPSGEGVVIRGIAPYSDAAGLAKRELVGSIVVDIPVAM